MFGGNINFGALESSISLGKQVIDSLGKMNESKSDSSAIVIHKFILMEGTIALPYSAAIEIPSNAKILTVKYQRESICLWATVDTREIFTRRNFLLIGTGQYITADYWKLKYISTILILNDSFVVHVFEEE